MPGSRSISLHANGQTYALPAGTTLPAFLQDQGLAVERVVIERNGAPLTQAEARATVLEDGDRLEIVRIVAGG
ncbi:MAG: sulfur carrier protein ThiS [Opitutales bacterium]